MSGKLPKKPAIRRADSVMQFASELGTDQFNRMKEVFTLFADSKGRVTASQLLQVLNTLNINCTPEEAQTFFKELDGDGDGFIDFTEFIRGLKWIKTSALISPPTKEPKQISRTTSIKKFIEGMDDAAVLRTRQLFAMCDADGDGVITKPELFKLVKELGLDMTKVEVSLLFSTLDVNNDGKLQFNEFLEGMKWLNKGMNIATIRDAEAASTSSSTTSDRASEAALQDAQEANKLLLSFIKDLVAKTLETAKSEIQNNKLRSADILLQIVDVNRITDLEVMIGTIVDKKDVVLYHKMTDLLKQKAKEGAAARK